MLPKKIIINLKEKKNIIAKKTVFQNLDNFQYLKRYAKRKKSSMKIGAYERKGT